MHTASLRKVGGSVMLAVPPVLLDLLGLEAGATVGLAVDNGRLVVEPRHRVRYSLDELLAQCDPSTEAESGEPTPEDREWTSGSPTGRELL